MTDKAAVAFVNVSGANRSVVISIGGFNDNRRLWRIPAQEAVVLIQSRLWAFYIDGFGPKIELAVTMVPDGRFRLTTTAGDAPLLALPEYPSPTHCDLARRNANEDYFVNLGPFLQGDFGLPVGEFAT